MTRINSAIPVKSLTDEHLLAEHREIKRLPYFLRKAIQTGSVKHIPDTSRLGKGHVTFFLDKQRFIYKRYISIREELIQRGFNVTDFSENWKGFVYGTYWNDYEPTQEERHMLIERITQKIQDSGKQTWHYYGRPISKEEAVEILIEL